MRFGGVVRCGVHHTIKERRSGAVVSWEENKFVRFGCSSRYMERRKEGHSRVERQDVGVK